MFQGTFPPILQIYTHVYIYMLYKQTNIKNEGVVYRYRDRQTDQETEKRAPQKILVYMELLMTEMAR